MSNYMSFNFPSPYKNPEFNYGSGPQLVNALENGTYAPFKEPHLRAPTANNPLMNLSPLDYGARPLFNGHENAFNGPYEKISYPARKIEYEFNKGLVPDPDSLFWNRLNSQREFVSVPVATVPNSQNEFAQWLYGHPEGVCKQGSVFSKYGVLYTKDSMLCNGSNASTITNAGLMDNFMSSTEN